MAMTMAGACAATSAVRWSPEPVPALLPSAGPVFVMDPISSTRAYYRNSSSHGDPASIEREMGARILDIVRTRFPAAEMVSEGPQMAMRIVPGYRTAAGAGVVGSTEYNAACHAYARGATHLLVPTIVEWRQVRTDDPIGTFVAPHNRIIIDLRLMRLEPAAVVGHAVFTNKARLTFNQAADRLLDDDFRKTVLRFVSIGQPAR